MALFSATVNAAKVAATLSDYPAYIDLSEMPAAFWSTVTNGGGDIRCYSDEAKTTELAREVVSCDTGTDTGELHVKIPSLTTSTVIYIDVDGTRTEPAADSTYGSEAVWSDYEFVTHDGGLTESTGNLSLTANGDLPTSVTGKIGAAQLFGGDGDFYDTTTGVPLLGTGARTVSTWFKGTAEQEGTLFELGFQDSTDVGHDGERFRLGIRNVGSDYVLRLDVEENGENATTHVQDGNWHYAVATNSGSNLNNTTIYLDASTELNITTSQSINTKNDVLGVGQFVCRTDIDLFYNGTIDEVRLLVGSLSTDWITTEYNNQSDVANFWTLAEVQAATPFSQAVIIA